MLADYTRRHREYTGPTPHSVAIKAKPTRRRPAEHLILERRRKEALVEEAREETKFLKQCDLKSSWVKSTNKRIEKNTLKRRVQQELLKETFALEDRREMLREMLLKEEQGYIEEMESMEETTLERQAKMRERAKQLKEKRERERQEFVAEKLDQRWRDQCEELRSIQSKQNQDQICHERNEQLLLKEEAKKREEEMDKMYTELWETDRIAKSEREEQEEKNLIERNRECLKVLQLQMTSNAQKVEEEKKLKELEAEWLKEETRLRKEEEKWMKKEKLRRQEHAKRVRDASIKLKQKKEAKERNEELALEHELLEKLLEDTRKQEKADVQRKSDLREENLRFMAYVAKNRKDEQEREKKLEELIHEEVEVKWQKDLAKYRLEREARKKLLESVLDTRRQQIGEKNEKNEQLKREADKERDELERVIEEHKRMAQESNDKLKQRNRTYQRDLEMQIGYQKAIKARGKEEELDDYLAGKEAEKEYQRKLQAAIERPQSEKLHPSRRRTIERHGGSAR